jgi:hypothetical protein
MYHQTSVYIPPTIIRTNHTYLDVNHDKRLRQYVTNYFQKKIISLIENENEDFQKYKNKIDLLESLKGYKIIYSILKNYTKKTNTKWYDLRENNKYVIKYIYKKLELII